MAVILNKYTYYLFQFGDNHQQTTGSKDFLNAITKQAVQVERSLRQAGADSAEQTVEVRLCVSVVCDTLLTLP